MTEKLQKFGLDYAYLVDKAMVLIVLFAMYQLLTVQGDKWIKVQSEMVQEMVLGREAMTHQWKQVMEMKKADDASIEAVMKQFIETINIHHQGIKQP